MATRPKSYGSKMRDADYKDRIKAQKELHRDMHQSSVKFLKDLRKTLKNSEKTFSDYSYEQAKAVKKFYKARTVEEAMAAKDHARELQEAQKEQFKQNLKLYEQNAAFMNKRERKEWEKRLKAQRDELKDTARVHKDILDNTQDFLEELDNAFKDSTKAINASVLSALRGLGDDLRDIANTLNLDKLANGAEEAVDSAFESYKKMSIWGVETNKLLDEASALASKTGNKRSYQEAANIMTDIVESGVTNMEDATRIAVNAINSDITGIASETYKDLYFMGVKTSGDAETAQEMVSDISDTIVALRKSGYTQSAEELASLMNEMAESLNGAYHGNIDALSKATEELLIFSNALDDAQLSDQYLDITKDALNMSQKQFRETYSSAFAQVGVSADKFWAEARNGNIEGPMMELLEKIQAYDANTGNNELLRSTLAEKFGLDYNALISYLENPEVMRESLDLMKEVTANTEGAVDEIRKQQQVGVMTEVSNAFTNSPIVRSIGKFAGEFDIGWANAANIATATSHIGETFGKIKNFFKKNGNIGDTFSKFTNKFSSWFKGSGGGVVEDMAKAAANGVKETVAENMSETVTDIITDSAGDALGDALENKVKREIKEEVVEETTEALTKKALKEGTEEVIEGVAESALKGTGKFGKLLGKLGNFGGKIGSKVAGIGGKVAGIGGKVASMGSTAASSLSGGAITSAGAGLGAVAGGVVGGIALIDAGKDLVDAGKQGDWKEKEKKQSSAAIKGGLVAAGAALGSVVPGVGTLIGAGVGGLVALIGGDAAAEAFTSWVNGTNKIDKATKQLTESLENMEAVMANAETVDNLTATYEEAKRGLEMYAEGSAQYCYYQDMMNGVIKEMAEKYPEFISSLEPTTMEMENAIQAINAMTEAEQELAKLRAVEAAQAATESLEQKKKQFEKATKNKEKWDEKKQVYDQVYAAHDLLEQYGAKMVGGQYAVDINAPKEVLEAAALFNSGTAENMLESIGITKGDNLFKSDAEDAIAMLAHEGTNEFLQEYGKSQAGVNSAIATFTKDTKAIQDTLQSITQTNDILSAAKADDGSNTALWRELKNQYDYMTEMGFSDKDIGFNYYDLETKSGKDLDAFSVDSYVDGSHAEGLAEVPFDGYRAELHKGESILNTGEVSIFKKTLDFLTGANDKKPSIHEQSTVPTMAEDVRAIREYTDIKLADEKKGQFLKNLTSSPKSFFSLFGGISGSHAKGLDYVPQDGYVAELHKGETVLNRTAASMWRQNMRIRNIFDMNNPLNSRGEEGTTTENDNSDVVETIVWAVSRIERKLEEVKETSSRVSSGIAGIVNNRNRVSSRLYDNL